MLRLRAAASGQTESRRPRWLRAPASSKPGLFPRIDCVSYLAKTRPISPPWGRPAHHGSNRGPQRPRRPDRGDPSVAVAFAIAVLHFTGRIKAIANAVISDSLASHFRRDRSHPRDLASVPATSSRRLGTRPMSWRSWNARRVGSRSTNAPISAIGFAGNDHNSHRPRKLLTPECHAQQLPVQGTPRVTNYADFLDPGQERVDEGLWKVALVALSSEADIGAAGAAEACRDFRAFAAPVGELV